MIAKIIMTFLTQVLLLCIITLPMNAQQHKMPFQITSSFGVPLAFLNKDIYSGKPLNFSTQWGLMFSKSLSNTFSISAEGQYNRFNLASNIEKTYQPFITNNSIKNFSHSTAINGIVNVQYSKKSGDRKKGGETGIALGAGIQRLIVGGNNLQIPNSFQGNQLTSVYKDAKGKYTNPIFQLTLEHTWYIKPFVGIIVEVKVQYVKNANSTTYKKMPPNTDGQLAFEQFINSPNMETKQQRSFILVPTIGIQF